jgi:hypothetical protein
MTGEAWIVSLRGDLRAGQVNFSPMECIREQKVNFYLMSKRPSVLKPNASERFNSVVGGKTCHKRGYRTCARSIIASAAAGWPRQKDQRIEGIIGVDRKIECRQFSWPHLCGPGGVATYRRREVSTCRQSRLFIGIRFC